LVAPSGECIRGYKHLAVDCSRLAPLCGSFLPVLNPVVIPGLRAGTCCAVLRGSLLIVCKQVRLPLCNKELLYCIGVDLAGILGSRMASAKCGLVPRGVGYGEGCPFRSQLGGPGERRQLPQRGLGQSPGRKRILAYFEGHRTLFLYLYDKI